MERGDAGDVGLVFEGNVEGCSTCYAAVVVVVRAGGGGCGCGGSDWGFWVVGLKHFNLLN